MNLFIRRFLCSLILVAFVAARAAAGTIYVDNVRGDDANDGRAPTGTGAGTGPTRTIAKALTLARHGDTVSINNAGLPYYESVTLSGYEHSGHDALAFSIVSNGAVIDGTKAVRPEAWKLVGENLWRFTPWRKGYYGLYLDGKPVPRHALKNAGENPRLVPRGIPAGHWAVVAGTVYYQAVEKEDPATKPFRYAARSVGLTLHNVIGVEVSNLTFRNFRLDGVNAHDRCGIVRFSNVKSLNNARAGFTIAGCSGRLRMADDKLPTILLENCELTGNARHSLLLTGRGIAQVEKSKLDKKPTVGK